MFRETVRYTYTRTQGEGEKKDEHTGGARPKGPICFNCGKAGHIAAHCKELDDEGHATGHECFDQNTYHEFWKLEDNIWDDSGDPADIEDEVEPLQHGWCRPSQKRRSACRTSTCARRGE